MGNDLPWVQIGEASNYPDLEHIAPYPPTFSYPFQAVIACRVYPREFSQRQKFKWGFSAAFLLEEALDRQKLFIESQYANEFLSQVDRPEKRTLALRCIRRPDQPGLILGLIARVCAPTEETAHQSALQYWGEIQALFPYDFRLVPAVSQEEFRLLSGWELLNEARSQDSLVQIRRYENIFQTGKDPLYVLGTWETALRSDEQIWRALACHSAPVLYNVTMRPSGLPDRERNLLVDYGDRAKKVAEDSSIVFSKPVAEDSSLVFSKPVAEWAISSYKRRISAWPRSYLLQVHLVAPHGVPEFIVRAVGSALTRQPGADQTLPGYQVVHPLPAQGTKSLPAYLLWLEALPDVSANSGLDRLRDLADLAEAHAVFRFPYPPEEGIPDVSFG